MRGSGRGALPKPGVRHPEHKAQLRQGLLQGEGGMVAEEAALQVGWGSSAPHE